MRREKHLFERVIDFGNLYRAFVGASAGRPAWAGIVLAVQTSVCACCVGGMPPNPKQRSGGMMGNKDEAIT
jgi:hypothetical protein